jgi:serine/threonine-protein kinase
MFHDLSRESLLDLLLELAPERTNVEILISGGAGPARLALSNGKLIHAECDGARGPIAFEQILTFEKCRGEVVQGLRTSERTLDLPITPKVLRQFRRVDVSPTVAVQHTVAIQSSPFHSAPLQSSPLQNFGTKTLLQYQSPFAQELPKDTDRSSSRPPVAKRGKPAGTGYSSVPPPAIGEDVVAVPPSSRVPRGYSQRPPSVAPVATTRGGHGAVNARRLQSPPPIVLEAPEPDTGPVPSAKLDKSSLVRLEELNEALSSTSHAIPLRPEEPPPPPRERENDLATGDGSLPRVGRYEVLARLKSGGMGSIYLCRLSGSQGFQRLFAMKVLHQHLTEQQDALDLFFSEARLLAQLHHPNIVGIVDVGSVYQPYLVLDYVEGGSLKELLKASARTLEPGIVLSVILDALEGLSAAHQLQGENGEPIGLVHNDVSPHNLLVGIDGTCRVTDFGIARAQGHSPNSHTRGKPSFVAPERILRHRVDQRADLFSMGVVLYQCLTGIDPFLGATAEETLRNVLDRTAPPPSEVGLRPPPALDWICLKALAKDPNERFQTAEEMAQQLRRAAAREDLLVAPSTVAHWVRTVLAGPLEARRAATQRTGADEGRRRITIPPPGASSPSDRPLRPASDPPKSSDFNEKTEILSAPPPADAAAPARRNVLLYALLALTVAALVLVLVFPEHVQRYLRREASRPPSSEEAWLRRQSTGAAQTVPSGPAERTPDPANVGAPPQGAPSADASAVPGASVPDASALEPKVRLAPVPREAKP